MRELADISCAKFVRVRTIRNPKFNWSILFTRPTVTGGYFCFPRGAFISSIHIARTEYESRDSLAVCVIIADSFSLPLFFSIFLSFQPFIFSLSYSLTFSPEARQIHQIFFASAPSGPPVSSNVLSRAYRSASVYRLVRPHLKSRYLCLPFIIVRFEDRGKMITCVEGVRGATGWKVISFVGLKTREAHSICGTAPIARSRLSLRPHGSTETHEEGRSGVNGPGPSHALT